MAHEVAHGVSQSSTSDLWVIPEQDLVVLPLLARDCHSPYRDRSTSWGSHACPPPQEGLMAHRLDTM